MSEKQAIFTLLNGRVTMERGIYNPTSDAVWLAALAPTKVRTVLDVGIGSGGVSLCLLANNPSAEITGIDISENMLSACKRNMELNGANITLLKEDILKWSTTERFDLVITNPPYFKGTPAKHNAHHNTDIKDWTKKCCARVQQNGFFCTITDALCIDKVVSALENKHFGDTNIIPLFGAKNTAERVLICSKQGSKAGSTIHQGFSMNNDLILRDGLTICTLLSTLGTL